MYDVKLLVTYDVLIFYFYEKIENDPGSNDKMRGHTM